MLKRMFVPSLTTFLAVGSIAMVAAQTAPPSPTPPAASAPATAAPPNDATHNLLIAAHLSAGLQCASCHQEAPPSKPVQTATCLTCHGPYDALATKTASDNPNPHASHLGDLPCEACHHMHQPSVLYCAQCHSFDLTTP